MVTVLILAGGKSSRMGSDKAFMNGGVERLRQVSIDCGVDRIVTLCGSKGRLHMFQGEVWADPVGAKSLMEVLIWAMGQIQGQIQLIPCDAFSLDIGGLRALLESGGGVPMDASGHRQPLLSSCPDGFAVGNHTSIHSMFSHLPSLEMGGYADQMENFNAPRS